ncbi:MAG: ATP-binding protein [Kastovskya adunca ATA6-11-RM4]|jgi:hypothetical protein|nr:ATP-binding protein [Kastovskya adunca ATA6-11-RM4]
MTQATTVQTFGAFLDEVPASEEYLALNFSPNSAAARKRRWGNYGLSADFLGDYFAAFFPGDELPDSKISRKDTVKATVSYIANELLENAVKYSDPSANRPISITLHLYEREIIFQVTNYANQLAIEKYQDFIQELLNSDLEELYTRQLELTALGTTLGTGSSNMGLLTMMNDYSARFGWKFQLIPHNPELIRVTVMVHLDL